MALDLAVGGPVARRAEAQTLAPAQLVGPPPPPPIPPTPGMYLPGPPPPGVLLPRPIVVPLPLTREVIAQMDECRSRSLLKFISDAGLEPSLEDKRRRERVVRQLDKIVMDWAQRVAYEQGERHWVASATVLTFGSYDLGAYGPESDIDALCVGPYVASLQHHFFVVLRQILEGKPEVSELHSIEGAKVPLMRFKFNGILVDFPYVQLPVINAADRLMRQTQYLLKAMPNCELDIPPRKLAQHPDELCIYFKKAIRAFDPCVLDKVDGASWRCLSGVRVNRQIMQLVPHMKKFQYLLRCLKLWARKRGLHCHLLGFFAGIHLAILAAYVCRRHPNASINTLLSLFFDVFVHWPWPLPVSLLDPPPLCRSPDGCSLMPIMLPCIPPEFCSSSVTESTFNKIKEELRRGYALTKDVRSTDIDWNWLFAPFPYGARYKCFLRIVLSAPMAEELRDWVGWVKSRFRNLLLKLESLGVYCDPDPSEQVDHTITEPNVVFFWGLMYRRNIQICTSSLKEDFMKSVFNNIYGKEKCAHSDITMYIVGPPQLPKSVFDHSVYSEKLPPHMMGHQLMKQSYNGVG